MVDGRSLHENGLLWEDFMVSSGRSAYIGLYGCGAGKEERWRELVDVMVMSEGVGLAGGR